MRGDRVSRIERVPELGNRPRRVAVGCNPDCRDVLALAVHSVVLATPSDRVGLAVDASRSERERFRHTTPKKIRIELAIWGAVALVRKPFGSNIGWDRQRFLSKGFLRK